MKALEVRVSHSVKTCSPLIVLSLHSNVDVKHRHTFAGEMTAGYESRE